MRDGTDRPGSGVTHGFTLIEVLVAIAVTGIVIGGSAALVGAVADSEREARSRTHAAVGAFNSERLLAELVGNLVPSEATEIALSGTRSSAAFRSRCMRAGGWMARCSVRLELLGAPPRLRLHLSREPAIQLEIASPRRLLYLTEASGRRTFVTTWESSVPPLAVGVETAADTLILPVGVHP